MHTVSLLALHGVVPADLATPCEVFERVQVPGQRQAYRVRVCGEADDVKAGPFDIRVRWGLSHLADADTIIVPGLANPTAPIAPAAIATLQQAAGRGTRIASICTGAFVLAAAGLLDGLRATTHWLAAAELARLYPKVRVDPNVLYVDNGRILTSAGAAAALDLCLHMVRRDCGAAVAADAARMSVMPLERDGGQAQFIVHEPPGAHGNLRPLLHWLEQHLHQRLTIESMARRCHVSARTLSRRFVEQTGTTPLQWLLSARVRRAQQLLETTQRPVEQIAGDAGFGSASALRVQFARVVGISPQTYRQRFGGRALPPESSFERPGPGLGPPVSQGAPRRREAT
ncbi:helix-turn-helix domain-containing protein [Schlegelella sp. S2-27]|uniref:Helix-turn-helix domain-containing protein n=1 Tax=Caldimonas mangrovi TaxID=2944811 RepID=A0ABT0YX97_9BURK|nr:helix-turn-helix domain-containing protein [Caldimonas mangrovi]MCM5682801.1 helix-turn-helix domain-containing protein [Caldimonas mangrovi]